MAKSSDPKAVNRDLSSDIDHLRAALVEVAQPEKAEPMAAYMKGHFELWGYFAEPLDRAAPLGEGVGSRGS